MIYLTDRCYGIVVYLLEQQSFITAKHLAMRFSVSERTIRYDIELISDWLKEKDVVLIRKPRCGIKVKDVEKANEKLNSFLANLNYLEEHVLSDKERRSIIKNALFKSQKPILIKDLTELLCVSRTTIINDINYIEDWLRKKDIGLIRRPGYGLQLDCKELEWRKGVIDYFYENADKKCMLKFLNLTNFKATRTTRFDAILEMQIMEMFDSVSIKDIDECVNFIENDLNIEFFDASYASIALHIGLALKRLQENKKITMPLSQLNALKGTREFLTAKNVTMHLEQTYNLTIPETETGYITLHILGAKFRNILTATNDKKHAYSQEEKIFTQRFLDNICRIFDINIKNDKELKNNLLLHAKPMINRLKNELNSFNPLNSQIKLCYPDVFIACKKVAGKILRSLIDKDIDDNETGYLTLHIIAALEKRKAIHKKNDSVKAVIVCSTGVGTSLLLESRLKKELPDINILGEISLVELDKVLLSEVDIIISTIPIDNIYLKPVVHVSPLLSDEDVYKIKRIVCKYKGSSYTPHNTDVKELMEVVERYGNIRDYEALKEEICAILNIPNYKKNINNTSAIADLIEEEGVKVKVDAKDYKEAIELAGNLLMIKKAVKKEYINAMIKNCKNMNAYIVICPGVAIAHARFEEGVIKTAMSLITLNTPVYFGHKTNDPVSIVMALAVADEKKHLKALNELSRILQHSKYVEKINNCLDAQDVLKTINNAIKNY